LVSLGQRGGGLGFEVVSNIQPGKDFKHILFLVCKKGNAITR